MRTSAGRAPRVIREVGVHAAVGVPVIVDGRVWGLAAVASVGPGPMPADTDARISSFAELVATALVAGYRDEKKRQLFGEASRRPFLIEALFEGRLLCECNAWDVARYLRFPRRAVSGIRGVSPASVAAAT